MDTNYCVCNCQYCRSGQHCGGLFCSPAEYCTYPANGNVVEIINTEYEDENEENESRSSRRKGKIR